MKSRDTQKTTPTTEEYLEIIYMIAAEGQRIWSARLAEYLRVSRPNVTATLRRMSRDGLVKLNRKKEIGLTRKGFALADAFQRRHRIVERWLTDGLGFDWAESDAEAHRLEHVMSDAVVERLNEVLGRPATCPHGNPIPGNAQPRDRRQVFPLGQSHSGDRVQIVRISEYAENTGELLRDLGARGLRPGVRVQVTDVAPVHQTLTLKMKDKYFSLSPQTAQYIWVARI